MTKIKDQLKIGIILNYVNLIVGNLIPIFYTPIMLNLLGQSEYGLYKLASSVTSYISLMSLGIGSAMTRYLIKSRTEEGEDGEKKNTWTILNHLQYYCNSLLHYRHYTGFMSGIFLQ